MLADLAVLWLSWGDRASPAVPVALFGIAWTAAVYMLSKLVECCTLVSGTEIYHCHSRQP
jgi:hypothetical protein